MYYRINDKPQSDSEIIYNTMQNIESPKIPNITHLKLTSSHPAKFPLWVLLIILFGLGIVGIIMVLQINKKYSFTKSKNSNFGIFK